VVESGGSELDLRGTQITDAGLTGLRGLTSLETLILVTPGRTRTGASSDETRVTDAGLVHLSGLTGLRGLILPSRVTDAGLVHLSGLTSLETLILFETRVTDAGLVHLRGLTNLRELYLYGTQITDAGLVHLSGLTSLERLDLRGTQITDAGLVHLQGLTSLRELWLAGTQVTDAGLASLRQALPNWGRARTGASSDPGPGGRPGGQARRGGQPERPPAAAASGPPQTPSRDSVVSAMNSVLSAVTACGSGMHHGTAPVRINFSGSTGRVTSAQVSGGNFPGPVRSCIVRAVRGARVPPFRQSSYSVYFPFRLSEDGAPAPLAR